VSSSAKPPIGVNGRRLLVRFRMPLGGQDRVPSKRHAVEQLRLLEDETNVVQSEFLQLFHAQLDQILASDGNGTAGDQVFDRAAAFDTARRQF
jgi:hypothetical protein